MKGLVGMALATLLVPGAAYAADAGPWFSWGGLYIGANAGYSTGDVDLSNVRRDGNPETYGSSFDPSGGLAGGQIGYNFQTEKLVLGIETDLQWADMSVTNDLNDSAKLKYFGTVRGRIGYAVDRLLPYLTAGFAYGEGEATLRKSGVTITDSHTHTGWTVGAGIEAALQDNLSLKVEYLYVDTGAQGYTWSRFGSTFTADGAFNFSVIRAGINYKF